MITNNIEINFRRILEKEGYGNFQVKKDSAGKRIAPHRHDYKLAHVVLEGQLTVTVFGRPTILDSGDRLDVPAGVIHEAVSGANGSEYLIAEKMENEKSENENKPTVS